MNSSSTDGPAPNNEGSGASNAAGNQDSVVLEEEIDPNYVPSESEVIEYAKWLGMDMEKDQDLFWVAKEGLMAPLPKNWKPCKTKDTEDIYYFNFATGESTWDHPCDGYYKRIFEEQKKKKETAEKEKNDQTRTQAKADVDKLLGKDQEKKKKKKKANDIDSLGRNKSMNKSASSVLNKAPLGPIGGGGASLDKRALPGISSSVSSLNVRSSTEISRQSQDSTLSISESSDTSSRQGGAVLKREPYNDTASVQSSQSKSKKSKIASRFDAVKRDSTESQLPSPDMKSTIDTAESKQMDAHQSHIADSMDSKPVSILSPQKSSSMSNGDRYHAEEHRQSDRRRHDDHNKSRVSWEDLDYTEPMKNDKMTHSKDYDRVHEENLDLKKKVRRLEEDLTKRRGRHADEIQELENKLSKEKRRRADIDDLLVKSQDQERDLEQKIRNMKTKMDVKVDEVNAIAENLQKENDSLCSELSGLRPVDSESISNDINVVGPLKEQIRQLERDLNVSKEKEDSLKIDITTNDDIHNTKIKELSESQTVEKEQLKQEVADLQKKLDESETKCTSQSTLLDFKEALLVKSETTIETSSKATKSLQEEIDQLKQKSTTLEDSLKVSDDALKALRESTTNDKSSHSELVMESTKLSTIVTNLRNELYEVKSNFDDMEHKHKRAENSVKHLEGELEDKEEKLKQMRMKKKEVEEQLETAEVDNRAITSRFTRLKTEKDELEQSIVEKERSMQKAMTALKGEAMEAEKNLDIVKADLRRNKDEFFQYQEQMRDQATNGESGSTSVLNDISSRLSKTQLENQELERNASDLQLQLRRALEDNSTLQSKLLSASSQQDKGATTTTTTFLASDTIVGQEEKKALQDQVIRLEEELNLAKQSLSSVSTAKIALQDTLYPELTNLKNKNNLLVEENSGLTLKLNTSAAKIVDLETDINQLRIVESTQKTKIEMLEKELFNNRQRLEQQAFAAATTTTTTTSNNNSNDFRVHSSDSTSQDIAELRVIVRQQSEAMKLMQDQLRKTELQLSAAAASGQSTSGKQAASERSDDAVDVDLDRSLLIREMLLDFVQRRKSLGNVGTGDVLNMNTVLAKETKFIDDTRKALKEQKNSIRWQQQLLLKKRDMWKSQRHSRSTTTQSALNRETMQLNAAVDQSKKTARWLSNREDKLTRLQQLIRTSDSSNDLEIELLLKDLDADTLNIGLNEPFTGIDKVHVGLTDLPPMMPSTGAFATENGPEGFSYFPEHPTSYANNNYMKARGENMPPPAPHHHQTGDAGQKVTNTMPLANLDENAMAYDKEHHRIAKKAVLDAVRDRELGDALFENHAGWLNQIRQQINTFQGGRPDVKENQSTNTNNLLQSYDI